MEHQRGGYLGFVKPDLTLQPCSAAACPIISCCCPAFLDLRQATLALSCYFWVRI